MGASCGGGVTVSDSLSGLTASSLQELEPWPRAAGTAAGGAAAAVATGTVDTSDSVREASLEVLR